MEVKNIKVVVYLPILSGFPGIYQTFDNRQEFPNINKYPIISLQMSNSPSPFSEVQYDKIVVLRFTKHIIQP